MTSFYWDYVWLAGITLGVVFLLAL